MSCLWGFAVSRTAASISVTNFGYLHSTLGGAPSIGTRPLVVILAAFGTSSLSHTASYYDGLVFTNAAASVNGFVRENSNGRFQYSRAAVIGPILFANSDRIFPNYTNDIAAYESNFIAKVILSGAFDFSQYTNSSGVVTDDRIEILKISNDSSDGNRPINPVHINNYTITGYLADVGDQNGIYTLLHELSHGLGDPLVGPMDIYGASQILSANLAVMGGSPTTDSDLFHHDPVQKMRLGWSEPRVRSIAAGGFEVLPAAQLQRPDAPVLLYDPARGTNDFFVIEYRASTSSLGSGYDKDVASSGLAIWQARQKTSNFDPDDTGDGFEISEVAMAEAGPGAQHCWNICTKCQTVSFLPNTASSHCPAGGTHNVPSGAGALALNPQTPGESNWLWCRKCESLFYGPNQSISRCPDVTGGTNHDGSASGNYRLATNFVQGDFILPFDRCVKCQSLFNTNSMSTSRCPVNGSHLPAGTRIYRLYSCDRAIFDLAAPDFTRGGRLLWSGGSLTPYLVWPDGTVSRTRIYVHPFSPGDDQITFEWWTDSDVYVDFTWLGSENGTINFPFNTLAEGLNAVSWGGSLHIKTGHTPETATFTKRMYLNGYGGTATLGR